MPAGVTTDNGEKLCLKAALTPRRFLRLYRSDQPVNTDSALGDFTTAAFPGYADIEVTDYWSDPAIDGAERAYSRTGNVVWVRGAGGVEETEYGWLLYEAPDPDSVLIAGGRFTAGLTTNAPGQTITVSILALLLRG